MKTEELMNGWDGEGLLFSCFLSSLDLVHVAISNFPRPLSVIFPKSFSKYVVQSCMAGTI